MIFSCSTDIWMPRVAETNTASGSCCEEGGSSSVLQRIDLVEDDDHALVAGPDVLQRLLDHRHLLFEQRMADVHDVEKDIGLADLIECALERRHQMVGELPDESDGVREQDRMQGREADAADGGIQRCEQAVLREDAGIGEAVQERGFPGIGVANEGNAGELLAPLPLGLPFTVDVAELRPEVADACTDRATVRRPAFRPAPSCRCRRTVSKDGVH